MNKTVRVLVVLQILAVLTGCSQQTGGSKSSTNSNQTNAASSPVAAADFPICGPDTKSRIMIVTGLTTPATAKVNTPFQITVSATNIGGCHAREASTSINLLGPPGGQMIINYTNLDKGDQETNTRSITPTQTGDLKIVAFSFVVVGAELVNNEPEGRQERIVRVIP